MIIIIGLFLTITGRINSGLLSSSAQNLLQTEGSSLVQREGRSHRPSAGHRAESEGSPRRRWWWVNRGCWCCQSLEGLLPSSTFWRRAWWSCLSQCGPFDRGWTKPNQDSGISLFLLWYRHKMSNIHWMHVADYWGTAEAFLSDNRAEGEDPTGCSIAVTTFTSRWH